MDDERIVECCRGFGDDVIMTSRSCKKWHSLFIASENLKYGMLIRDRFIVNAW
jgi:CMP-2-keto-3-deoxyoctulosonic acid synthetase